MSNTTLVTGIWDLGRSGLSDGWSRSFDHYIKNFKILLEQTKNQNLVIFIDKSIEHIVWSIREKHNTVVHHHSIDDFGENFFPFRKQVEEIRNNQDWLNQVGWLRESTQAKLPMYNPMVMSKMFLLHNAKIFNHFNSDYYFWIDGGITNTVHPGYFSDDNVIEKITEWLDNFLFVCFPYETTTEIHGFDINEMKKISNTESVNIVARGGFFGGRAETISKANNMYYEILSNSLRSGYMGTEESIFTIMSYLDNKLFRCEMINGDGLIGTFFEKVKNNTITQHNKNQKIFKNNNIELYINTFNSPEQLSMVINSFKKHEKKLLDNTIKILINNSTDKKYDLQYDQICSKYGFEQIKRGNMGICRARQYCAEKFYESKNRYMLFFEDDMLIDYNGLCNFGFNKKVNNLYDNIISIMNDENYDFLKLSFSEFYGHNGKQWSWHNVPEPKKTEYFGKINDKPDTIFKSIKTKNMIPYVNGEIYYSNWPHIINQEGNQKMFLDTKWDHPFEQTWMSYIYTLTKKNIVNPAVLLASPITHNRVHFYEASERKEN
jgi:hypothetical protein